MGRLAQPLSDVPEVIDRYLERIVAELVDVFGDRVVGVWLLGSLAYGGFGPASDVDVQAAVRDPRDAEIAALVDRIRHPILPCPAEGLEFVLYDTVRLERPTPPLQWSLNLNGGPRREPKVQTDPASESWHWFLLDLAVGQQTAKTLYGRDMADVVGSISRDEQMAALAESVRWHARHEAGNPNQGANAARALRFIRTGQWGSKQDGIRWVAAQGHSPEEAGTQLMNELEDGGPVEVR